VGVAATTTFVLTVLLPAIRKDLLPQAFPESLIKVSASLITDEGNLLTLRAPGGGATIVLSNNVPLLVTISNQSDFTATIDEILVHECDADTWWPFMAEHGPIAIWKPWRSPEPWRRFQIPAEHCPRISAAFLAEERRTMGDWWFAQEYGCDFLNAETQPFSRDDIEHAFAEEVEAWAL
jgi:hypothetical protein